MAFFDLSLIDKEKHRSIRKHLLWEFDLDDFDYQQGKPIVVERVIERGNMDDWLTIFNLYGYDGVREQIKTIAYLNDRDLNFVHIVFQIPLAELKCYVKKQSATTHWTS